MRKLMFIAILIAATSSMAFAQGGDDYSKVEFHAGFSHARVDTGVEDPDLDDDFADFLSDRRGYNGFSASVTGNFHRYVGVKGDVSGYFKSDSLTDSGITINSRERMWYFTGGLQFKDNSRETRVKPFGHVLAGGAHQSIRFTSPLIADSFDVDDTSFAMKIGGGVDVRVSPRVDVRAIEFNYAPIFSGDRTIDGTTFSGSTQHNFTVGVGIVIR